MAAVSQFGRFLALLKEWPRRRLLLVIAPILALAVILPNAWIAEDAFITLRVTKNIVVGHGPVWNLNDRVQVFTHPLWMIILTFVQWIFPRYIPAAVIWLGIITTLAALVLFLRDIKSRWVLLLSLILILSSKAFIDFSTSGLENPLLYILVILFAHEYLGKRRPFWLSLIAALGVTTRADTAALFLPAFIPLIVDQWRQKAFWLDLLKGATPLIAWESFSLGFYGYLLQCHLVNVTMD